MVCDHPTIQPLKDLLIGLLDAGSPSHAKTSLQLNLMYLFSYYFTLWVSNQSTLEKRQGPYIIILRLLYDVERYRFHFALL